MIRIIVLLWIGIFSAGSVSANSYMNVEGWMDFSGFEEPFNVPEREGVTGNLHWKLTSNGALTLNGSGPMPDYSVEDPAPWFAVRSEIQSIEIGEGVTSIGDYAFHLQYSNLTTITIAASVKKFGDLNRSFIGCSYVTRFIYVGMEPIPTSNSAMFSGITLENCSLVVPANAIARYRTEWGGSFMRIGEISATLTFEKEETFYHSGGENSSINNTLTVSGIAANVVAWRSSNTSVATIGYNGLITPIAPGTTIITGYIGNIEKSYTFTYLPQGGTEGAITWGVVDNVLILRGDGAMPIYDNAFNPPAWRSLNTYTHIDIGAGITEISEYAFYECTNFSSISIPNTVTEISRMNFIGCSSLTSFNVDANNPLFSSEGGVLFNKDKTTLLFFPAGRTGSYTIPTSVETIDEYAFSFTALSSVTIPNSVTSIEGFAFYNSINLIEIINLSKTPQAITDFVFDDYIYDNCQLLVYDVTAYKNADVWKEFKNIAALPRPFTLSDSEIYLLTDKTATLTAAMSPGQTGVVQWENSDPNIATIQQTETGTVTITANKQGKTVITASVGDYKDSCELWVIEAGESAIEGTVQIDDLQSVTIYLYMRLPESIEQSSLTKAKPVAGYVLLTKTIPNANGQYSFEDLPEGDYVIWVVIDGVDSEPSSEFFLPEGETMTGIDVSVKDNEVVVEVPILVVITKAEDLFDVNLNVYPNPFSSLLHIEGAEGSILRIFAADGRQVHAQKVTNHNETIHLEYLPTGLYMIQVENKVVRVIRN